MLSEGLRDCLDCTRRGGPSRQRGELFRRRQLLGDRLSCLLALLAPRECPWRCRSGGLSLLVLNPLYHSLSSAVDALEPSWADWVPGMVGTGAVGTLVVHLLLRLVFLEALPRLVPATAHAAHVRA